MKKIILSLVVVMTMLGTNVSYGKTVKNNGNKTVKVENVKSDKKDNHKGNVTETKGCTCTTCMELRKTENKKTENKKSENKTQVVNKTDRNQDKSQTVVNKNEKKETNRGSNKSTRTQGNKTTTNKTVVSRK